MVFSCINCNYETDDKSKWERHLLTKKHNTIDLTKNEKIQLQKEKLELQKKKLELQKIKEENKRIKEEQKELRLNKKEQEHLALQHLKLEEKRIAQEKLLELQKNKMEQKRIKEEEEKEQKRIKEETKRIKEEQKNNPINWDDLVYDNIKTDISFNFKSMILHKNSYFFEELLISILKNPKLRCMRFKDNDLELFNEEWKTHMFPDDDDLKYDINDVLERLKEIGSEFSDAIKYKHQYGIACNMSMNEGVRLKTLTQIIKNASIGFDFFYEKVKEEDDRKQKRIMQERGETLGESLEEKE
jgi:hypothetical protein